MKENNNWRKKQNSISVILVLILILGIFTFIFLNYSKEETIFGKTYINNIYVGGLNEKEAIALLKEKLEGEFVRKNIILSFKEYRKEITLKDIDGNYDYEKAVKKSLKNGKDKNQFKNMINIFMMRNKRYDYNLEFVFNNKKLNEISKKIISDISKKEKNADIKISNGNIEIIKEEIGIKLSKKDIKRQVIKKINNKKYSISLPITYIKPEITQEILEEINGVISNFSTSFSSGNINRVKNIEIATRAIDGKLLLPGEELSFNKTTGERSKSNGYFLANVILNGEYVKDYGGGVCQVSTTLYNAALLSGIEITERSPHSIPASYVPKGRDATVAYDYLDLKIKNTYDYPIYIEGNPYKNSIEFKIYGNTQDIKKK
ncbi:MAG: VanW family protein [Senegalia sp. (in: firmicutes)]|uniref:VanW family protein n=1 Tax=Senegalia sp. (in: firmicutes) TaxID=1924098 RepID=UPI003F9580BA